MRSIRARFLILAILIPLSMNSCGKPDSQELTPPVIVDEPVPAPSERPAVPYPTIIGQDFHGEKNFAFLINNFKEGKSNPTPWAGYWWPYTKNGIAEGGFGGGKSPAAKYDAARGRKTRAQEWEVSNHGTRVPKVAGWWGHCNGWCAASALFPEPRESVKVNGIIFTVADIKALLTEAGMEASADFFGERVDYASDYNTLKYYDVVPDQYFLVLCNYIGRLKQPVLIDRYTGDQVWNQPLAGYRFEYPKPQDYLGADPHSPHVYRIMVTSTIWWMRDDVLPDALTPPFNFEDNDFVQSRTLKMEVWVDAPVVFDGDGKIQSSGNLIATRQGEFVVGGAWRMGEGIFNDAWPDYMWVPYSFLKPSDYGNNQVDIQWIKDHLLVPGGADDTTASPAPIEPPPPIHTPAPPFPSPIPTVHPPSPRPTPTR